MTLPCIKGDVRNTSLLSKVFQDHEIEAVIHFAGLKAVGESSEKPIEYYGNNVQGTINLLEAMNSCNLKNLIFSSSATVYGVPKYLPIDESHPTNAINSYARTKLHIEEMLRDLAGSNLDWRIICLRYFNPVGAHESGLIGENPGGIPNNLMPYIANVAAGKASELSVYGGDYPTPDGTGVRDYIHVMDLAEGHLAAVNFLCDHHGFDAINLGTGLGLSVLEVVTAYSKNSGQNIPFKIINRRQGDVPEVYAKVNKAEEKLSWRAKRSIDICCQDSWRYISMNKL